MEELQKIFQEKADRDYRAKFAVMEESKEVSEEAPRLLDDPIYLEPIKFEKEKKAQQVKRGNTRGANEFSQAAEWEKYLEDAIEEIEDYVKLVGEEKCLEDSGSSLMPVTFTTWRNVVYKRIKDKVKDKKELLDLTDDFEVQVDGKHGPLSKYIIMLTKHYIREIKSGDGKLQKEYKKHLDDKKERKLHKEKFDDLIEQIAINQVYIELCDDLFRRISLYDPTVRPEIMHVLFKQMHASWVVHWNGKEGPRVKMQESKEDHKAVEGLLEIFEITGLKEELEDEVKDTFKEIKEEILKELVKSVIPFSGLVSQIGKGMKHIFQFEKSEHQLAEFVKYYQKVNKNLLERYNVAVKSLVVYLKDENKKTEAELKEAIVKLVKGMKEKK